MKRLMRTVGLAVVGLVVGYCIASIDQDMYALWMLFGVGVPFGWSFINRHLGSVIIGNWLVMLVVFAFKLVISGTIGFILMPFELIMSVREIVAERNVA